MPYPSDEENMSAAQRREQQIQQAIRTYEQDLIRIHAEADNQRAIAIQRYNDAMARIEQTYPDQSNQEGDPS